MTCKKCQGTGRIRLFLSANVCEHCGGTGTDPKWTKKDGVIRFSVTSDGASGKEWTVRLSRSLVAHHVLGSDQFRTTSDVTTEIVVIGAATFVKREIDGWEICAEAQRRGLTTPNHEIACLIREKFSVNDFQDMGLQSLVVMHEPVKNIDGDPVQLCLYDEMDGFWLGSVYRNLILRFSSRTTKVSPSSTRKLIDLVA